MWAKLADEPRGLVRLSAPVALGRQHVAPSLEAFLRAWPGIRVELELDDRLVNLAREGFDLAVRHTSAAPDSHVAWRLCGSRTLLVASGAYLRKRGRPEHPAELEAHDSLLYLRPGPARWMFERASARGAAEPERVSVAVQGPLRVNNSEVLRDAVLAGLGLGQLPDFSAAVAMRAGRLQALLPDWRPVGSFGDTIYALRPWTPQVPRAVRALVDHLRAALAPGFGAARS
jgi:DNA-binding transcriptional LysR family regulator